jgi:hypothetical protein
MQVVRQLSGNRQAAEENEKPEIELFNSCFLRRRIRPDRIEIFYRTRTCTAHEYQLYGEYGYDRKAE